MTTNLCIKKIDFTSITIVIEEVHLNNLLMSQTLHCLLGNSPWIRSCHSSTLLVGVLLEGHGNVPFWAGIEYPH